MQATTDESRRAAAARAFLETLKLLAGTQPAGGFHEAAGGAVEMIMGIPIASLNGVLAVTGNPSPDEIAQLAASPRLAEWPWTIQVRGEDVDERIVRIAAEHGLNQRSTRPIMLRDLTAADAIADLPGARRLTAADSDSYRRALAAGFEGPEDLFTGFANPDVINLPAASTYLVEVDGEPVATAYGILTDDTVGVFNVSVPPQFRRRGYGRLATAAVLRDAAAAGARFAYLQASSDGYPLYQEMGFQLAETWSIFSR